MGKVLIIGSEGTVGSRLISAFPGCITMDVAGTPSHKADLLDFPELPDCDAVIMAACFSREPHAPFEVQQKNLLMNEFVVFSAASKGVPVVFASSIWADVHPLNAYGCMKRCTEQLVESYGGESVRVGWVGYTEEDWESAPELRKFAWSDDVLCKAFRSAVEKSMSKPFSKISEARKNLGTIMSSAKAD